MRILVTGSHGYIGSVLAPSLVDAGHEVTGLDAAFYRGCDFGPDVGEIPTIWRDVRDVRAAELEGIDAVVHMAELSNDPVGELDPAVTSEINCDATVSLAAAAREAGVRRFVFASSCSMYGASGSDDLLDEHAPLQPITAYAESKVRAEEALVRGWPGPSLPPSTCETQPSTGVSPRLRLRHRPQQPRGVEPHRRASSGSLSDGRAWRPMIHVRDVAKVAGALLAAPEASIRGASVNVGTDAQNSRIRDLAEVHSPRSPAAPSRSRMAPASTLGPAPGRLLEARQAPPRARARLERRGRGPRAGGELPLRRRLTVEDFEGDRFTRLRRLRRLLDEGSIDATLHWLGPAELRPSRLKPPRSASTAVTCVWIAA